MGEQGGEESYLIQSEKGFMWSNIPYDLGTLLNRVNHRDVLDFSLGCSGRFYVRWMQGGTVKRKLSKGLWQEIGKDPNDALERLALGSEGQHWGVSRDKSGTYWTFSNVKGSLRGQLDKLSRSQFSGDFWFVALGVGDSFSYSVNGTPCTRSHDDGLKAALERARMNGKTVMDVALSPIRRDIWLILFADGTYHYCIHPAWVDAAVPFMQPAFSMIPKPAPVKVAPAIKTLQAHGSATSILPRYQPAPLSTKIRQLSDGDVEFNEVWRLFFLGWKHPHKNRPSYLHIYALDLPPVLLRPYDAYRSSLIDQIGVVRLNERKLFHGTPRACCIGDPGTVLTLCTLASCNVCSIIRGSFQLSRAGTAPNRNFMRFGRGIYTTSVSSKADDYNSKQWNSSYKAMLVAKVVLGNGFPIYRTCKTLLEPPYQWDSVLGEVGEDLNYDEQVVYRDEAIRPAYLILYEP